MKSLNSMFLAFLSLTVLLTASCKKDNKNDPAPIYGPTAPLGKGTARSFVILDAAGKPVTLGIKFSASSLSGLPQDTTMEWEYPLELPDEAKVTGYDHLVIDWNPVGHDPKPIYGLPHFDFHFYRITKAEQASVVPGPDNTPVPPNYIPQDYMSGVIAVPDMGVHWIDSLAPEFKGKKFTDTYIYGFYHGQLTFTEDMATIEWLSGKPDFKLNIKQPKAWQKSGYYPAVSHVSYEEATQEYTIGLEGLTFSDAK